MSLKISTIIIGSVNLDTKDLAGIGDVKAFKVTDKKSCDEIVNHAVDDDVVFIISDGREVYYAEKFFSRLPALKIYLVTEAHAADNKNLRDVIIQLPVSDFTHSVHAIINASYDLLNVEGIVSLDFQDLQAVLKNSGRAVALLGEGETFDSAVDKALASHDVKSAGAIVANFKSSVNAAKVPVINAAIEKIQSAVQSDAVMLWGVTVDETFTDKVQCAIIATKLD